MPAERFFIKQARRTPGGPVLYIKNWHKSYPATISPTPFRMYVGR